jgi:crotonobetaine/carnitine-CoA ligase
VNPLRVDLGTLIDEGANVHGDRPLLSFQDGTTFTYERFAELVARARGLLATRGVGPGGRVALMFKNSLFYPTAWLGVTTLGAVAVPVNSRLGPDDAGYVVRHSGAELLICDSSTAPVARTVAEGRLPVLEVEPEAHEPDVLRSAEARGREHTTVDTLANVQYTSGTTGFPKGCLLTHGYWQRMGAVAAGVFGLRSEDRILTAQPFSYIDPLWNVVSALQVGAHLVVGDGFHPTTFMSTVADWKVTVFYCLGVMPSLLMKQQERAFEQDLALRRVICSAIPPPLHADIERRWGAPWIEAFGMTETGINTAVPDEDHDALVGSGSIGRALPHCRASVVDEEGTEVRPGEVGELRLQGEGLMDGYLDDPEATAAFFRDGWAHTGDLVEVDDRGFLFYRGRRKEMIRRGGENVSQAEVEYALRTHQDVLDCAVAPVPDDALGEEAKAYVVLLPGRPPDPSSLRDFLAGKLASFKVPRYWEFRDDLPRTPSERIAKARLEPGGDWRAATYDARDGTWLDKGRELP